MGYRDPASPPLREHRLRVGRAEAVGLAMIGGLTGAALLLVPAAAPWMALAGGLAGGALLLTARKQLRRITLFRDRVEIVRLLGARLVLPVERVVVAAIGDEGLTLQADDVVVPVHVLTFGTRAEMIDFTEALARARRDREEREARVRVEPADEESAEEPADQAARTDDEGLPPREREG